MTAVDPGEGFRLLAQGAAETYRERDGVWADADGWIDIAPGCVGELAVRGAVPVRRAVRPAAFPGYRTPDAGETVAEGWMRTNAYAYHGPAPSRLHDDDAGFVVKRDNTSWLVPWRDDPRLARPAPEAPLSIAAIRAALPWTSPTPPRGWRALGVEIIAAGDVFVAHGQVDEAYLAIGARVPTPWAESNCYGGGWYFGWLRPISAEATKPAPAEVAARCAQCGAGVGGVVLRRGRVFCGVPCANAWAADGCPAPVCGARSPDPEPGFTGHECTLPAGHGAAHIARAADGEVCASWGHDPAPAEATIVVIPDDDDSQPYAIERFARGGSREVPAETPPECVSHIRDVPEYHHPRSVGRRTHAALTVAGPGTDADDCAADAVPEGIVRRAR